MASTTIKKVSGEDSPTGQLGQKYLVSGVSVSMRLWEEKAGEGDLRRHARDYETVGYVLDGKADLLIDDITMTLVKGDSWLVPKGAPHEYRILEDFTAIEATSPPAHVHGRDES